MKVVKRNGDIQSLSFDKVLVRIRNLCQDEALGVLEGVDYEVVAQNVVSFIYDGVTTLELDQEATRICLHTSTHPNYAVLASRIIISSMQKATPETFSEAVEILYKHGRVNPEYYNLVKRHAASIDLEIVHSRDYSFDYFGFKTLERAYLLKVDELVERPQYMYMRVALSIHGDDLENVFKTYHLCSQHYYTHASPTLFNAGTKMQNMSSCYLLGTEDSIEGIFKTLTDCALTSKIGGGLGVHVSNIRGKGSEIRGTNGVSDGIVPMLKMYNELSVYVNQCFTPESLVYSVNGPVRMDSVNEGLKLVTLDGTFKKVNQVFKTLVNKPVLSVTTSNSIKPTRVTREHEVYLLKAINGAKTEVSKSLLERGFLVPEFTTADQIRVGDYMASPVPQYPKGEHPSHPNQKFSLLIQGLPFKADGKTFTHDGKVWSQIVSVTSEVYQGNVYDFEMVDNHNYLTDMGIVHNSGKRKGSIAMYLEPWHPEIFEFLELKKNQGAPEMRARYLFYSIWTPDLFMEMVQSDGDWYLMCPDKCPGLQDAYGDDFTKLYNHYISTNQFNRKVKARDIWAKILEAQIESGVPYIGYKDSVNKKCNQKNLGTIKSSNLCTEISLYSDNENYAVCNLCSISLPKFVKENGEYDYQALHEVAKYTVISLNKVIDNNYYPTPEARRSDEKNRPLGIGIQGLVDVYAMMGLPYESKEAKEVNIKIFETLYHGTLEQSVELAKVHGPYKSYPGSPFSQGKFQFDLVQEHDGIDTSKYLSGMWDWDKLRADMKEYGVYNSMLTALMPTATTAQIMGNTESFELITDCMFSRRVLSGEFTVLNKHLVSRLEKLGLWNKEMREKLVLEGGSVQNIKEIPSDVRALFKTAWEVSMRAVIDQAADRGLFIDQMQSMNLHMASPTVQKLTSMHMYTWKKGLKTGMYYLRSKSSVSAAKFSVDAVKEKEFKEQADESAAALQCSIDNKEDCMMCSS